MSGEAWYEAIPREQRNIVVANMWYGKPRIYATHYGLTRCWNVSRGDKLLFAAAEWAACRRKVNGGRYDWRWQWRGISGRVKYKISRDGSGWAVSWGAGDMAVSATWDGAAAYVRSRFAAWEPCEKPVPQWT